MSGEPDRPLLPLLEGLSFRPVFIVGDHRSGTTLLHRILALTGSFHYLSSYHIIHYDEILTNHAAGREREVKQELEARFASLGLSDRVIDGVPVSADAPEEFGFILEDAARAHVTPANLERMVEICRKLRFSGGVDKPIVLKNPWDSLSFTYLKSSFPNAKMIFLHRHPLAVMSSQLRTIQSMLEVRNEYFALVARWYERMSRWPLKLAFLRFLFSSRFPLSRLLVRRKALRVNRYFAENIGKIPKQDCFTLSYEGLCRNPRETIESLLAFLEVRPEVALPYESLIAPRDPKLLPEISRHSQAMLAPFRPYLAAHGYQE